MGTPDITEPRIGIVDYGIGNLRSVANAIEVVGGDPALIVEPGAVAGCKGVVLPGVGAFAPGMRALRASGMIPALEDYVGNGNPLLGICLGMQILCRRSFEDGEHAGLGWIAADVIPFPSETGLKVPHMGWNTLHISQPHPLVQGLPPGGDAYFAHSYFVACDESGDVVAFCNYGTDFAAIVARGSVYGMQFHPEKSQNFGLMLLRNFIQGLDPG